MTLSNILLIYHSNQVTRFLLLSNINSNFKKLIPKKYLNSHSNLQLYSNNRFSKFITELLVSLDDKYSYLQFKSDNKVEFEFKELYGVQNLYDLPNVNLLSLSSL